MTAMLRILLLVIEFKYYGIIQYLIKFCHGPTRSVPVVGNWAQKVATGTDPVGGVQRIFRFGL